MEAPQSLLSGLRGSPRAASRESSLTGVAGVLGLPAAGGYLPGPGFLNRQTQAVDPMHCIRCPYKG